MMFLGTSYMGWCQCPDKGGSSTVFLTELVLLQISLAFAAPLNVSKLYQSKHAERSLVMMEWVKAYAGRLLGPIITLMVYNWIDYNALLFMLFSATVVVAVTA